MSITWELSVIFAFISINPLTILVNKFNLALKSATEITGDFLKMKLITHNMLTSKCLKGVTTGYPLSISATDVKVTEVDFNPEFISRIIPKLDWEVLWSAADSIGHSEGLPKTLEPKFEENEEFLKKAHKILVEIEVEEGTLTCPETGRKFPISKGIPNMLLTEAEVQ